MFLQIWLDLFIIYKMTDRKSPPEGTLDDNNQDLCHSRSVSFLSMRSSGFRNEWSLDPNFGFRRVISSYLLFDSSACLVAVRELWLTTVRIVLLKNRLFVFRNGQGNHPLGPTTSARSRPRLVSLAISSMAILKNIFAWVKNRKSHKWCSYLVNKSSSHCFLTLPSPSLKGTLVGGDSFFRFLVWSIFFEFRSTSSFGMLLGLCLRFNQLDSANINRRLASRWQFEIRRNFIPNIFVSAYIVISPRFDQLNQSWKCILFNVGLNCTSFENIKFRFLGF